MTRIAALVARGLRAISDAVSDEVLAECRLARMPVRRDFGRSLKRAAGTAQADEAVSPIDPWCGKFCAPDARNQYAGRVRAFGPRRVSDGTGRVANPVPPDYTGTEGPLSSIAPNPGIRCSTAFTWSGVISRVHSNWRGVSLWRGQRRKSPGPNSSRGSFQQLLQT